MMKTADLTSLAVLALIGVAGLVAWRTYQQGVSGVGRDVGATAVRAVDGAIQGAVETVGGALGIPLTDEAACREAIANQDTWQASLMCPAKEFFAATWTQIKTNTAGLPSLTNTADGAMYDPMGNRIN